MSTSDSHTTPTRRPGRANLGVRTLRGRNRADVRTRRAAQGPGRNARAIGQSYERRMGQLVRARLRWLLKRLADAQGALESLQVICEAVSIGHRDVWCSKSVRTAIAIIWAVEELHTEDPEEQAVIDDINALCKQAMTTLTTTDATLAEQD